ncbi:gas vesicle protein GvpJ [Dactylosporangium sp. NPDC050688]|uniref:gas vesicle protein n=1 Tax=Dactylosporangium sp. NPDC050688 TaxID=3157217 RepID=UPI0033F12655
MAASSPGLGPAPALGSGHQPTNLADILERVLDRGLVIAGDIQVNLLDIELLTLKLRLVIASVDTARQLGIDWWETDPWLSSSGRRAVGPGDPGRGSLGPGAGPRGEVGRGDTPRGELGRGDAPRGELERGDAPRGEAGRGDAPRGEAGRGDAPRGEAGRGDGPRGEAGTDAGSRPRSRRRDSWDER